ncbi:hypothetical protein L218DRAFT_376268 [Marasmius fiardii PR-910]|nr:hypothetical protein L218DRAFT_376268 [Marasmius fiardii PR-910]
MTVRGSHSETELFTKHGAVQGGLATRFRKTLQSIVNGIFVESATAASATLPNEQGRHCRNLVKTFHTPKPSQPSKPRISTPPIVERTPYPAAPITTAIASSPPPASTTSSVISVPRGTRSPAAARAEKRGGASRLAASRSATSSSTTTAKKYKLDSGAAQLISFEDAERKVLESGSKATTAISLALAPAPVDASRPFAIRRKWKGPWMMFRVTVGFRLSRQPTASRCHLI